MADTLLERETTADVAARRARPWRTVVWDDPINLMTYVTWVFMTYFAMSREEAERRMLQVHHEGRAVVSSGAREAMERDVLAMHGYGLQATIEQES